MLWNPNFVSLAFIAADTSQAQVGSRIAPALGLRDQVVNRGLCEGKEPAAPHTVMRFVFP